MALLRAIRITLQDLQWLPRNLIVNSLASATWMPRVARMAIYRAMGLRVLTPRVAEHCRFDGTGSIRIGRGTFVNTDCHFDALAAIAVGEDCALAMGVLICTSTHELTPNGFDPKSIGKDVVIGDRCWLGARATILPGVTVGDDVVIAAGAVVTKDCEPNSIYGGVPARRLRRPSP